MGFGFGWRVRVRVRVRVRAGVRVRVGVGLRLRARVRVEERVLGRLGEDVLRRADDDGQHEGRSAQRRDEGRDLRAAAGGDERC